MTLFSTVNIILLRRNMTKDSCPVHSRSVSEKIELLGFILMFQSGSLLKSALERVGT